MMDLKTKLCNKKTTNDNRIEWVDCAKAIAIILVGVGHYKCPENLLIWIYSFSMPLFFALSGVTLNVYKHNFKKFVLRKAKALLLPWAIGVVLNICFQMLCKYMNISAHPFKIQSVPLRLILNIRGGHYDPIYWFLPCLFVTEILLYGLLRVFGNHKKLILLIVFLMIAAIYQRLGYHALPWELDLVPMAAGFVIGGMYYKKIYEKYREKIKGFKEIGLIVILMFVGSALGFWNAYIIHEPIDMQAGRYGVVPIMFVAGMCLIISILLLCRHIHMGILQYIGKYSLIFYLAQPIAYKIVDIGLILIFRIIPFYNYSYGGNYFDLLLLHVCTNIVIALYVFIYTHLKNAIKIVRNREIRNVGRNNDKQKNRMD